MRGAQIDPVTQRPVFGETDKAKSEDDAEKLERAMAAVTAASSPEIEKIKEIVFSVLAGEVERILMEHPAGAVCLKVLDAMGRTQAAARNIAARIAKKHGIIITMDP